MIKLNCGIFFFFLRGGGRRMTIKNYNKCDRKSIIGDNYLHLYLLHKRSFLSTSATFFFFIIIYNIYTFLKVSSLFGNGKDYLMIKQNFITEVDQKHIL